MPIERDEKWKMDAANKAILVGIETFINSRVNAIAAEEIEAARERMKARIPELAAEIGVRISAMLADAVHAETVLQILIRPKLH